MKHQLICINCPKGCHLVVDDDSLTCEGNSCIKGKEYGISEVTEPKRIITTTVKVKNGNILMLPVKTAKAIPKDLNFKCIEVLRNIEVEAPILVGDVIYPNILDTNIDIVACRNVKKL